MLGKNSTLFDIKIQNGRELYQIVFNNWFDDSNEFINVYRRYSPEPYYFLIPGATLASDNFRRSL